MTHIIDDEILDNVCTLAQLNLSPKEREGAKAEMQKMLDFVEKLEELDTEGVEPMSHVFPLRNVFREDEVRNGDRREEMLANAPKKKDGQFQVPKTVE
ncbi:Asp-tRNA(Asn)/Glu-tRNA(Gln) amidotransferase subunit GatC [Cuneatibacter caecimuris]|uniref:Aspartyl/glutamyl-tRNA(Asn/Gln) amidotransferase subunit C n=1 Tax=Cuneatibacter caecimuris TaxID=1796618 RepID=A0A4Q7PKG4_9FIRM|nr:Asp-tRNA(Asn)/Glu-tRNA(Gln) amidotransferase subunit GatC [Cuneatibacter caecimuris]RZT00559.1 aspartyl/glutamyl-tRNA(Asn/Gln) amidotransferase subunit C [Cuneatibacter caecimuris]